jgi:hypothetical protein
MGTRLQKVMNLQINWQDWDLNILSLDLNQHEASQYGLTIGLSQIGQTWTAKNAGGP